MVLATYGRSYVLVFVLIALVDMVLRFYVARRIGKPKGRQWFWYAFFLGWLGVLILAFRTPKAGSVSAGGPGYHIPPGVAEQQRVGGDTHWMYDKPRN